MRLKLLLILFLLAARISANFAQKYVSTKGIEKRDSIIELLETFKDWESYIISGKDYKGLKAYFRILILTQEQKWEFAKKSTTESGLSIEDFLPSYLMQKIKLIKESKGVICIGSASYEGSVKYEELRAQERANNLGRVINKFLIENYISNNIYTLNIGKYVDANFRKSLNSASQRRIIIVLIEKNSDDTVNINQALRNALENDSNIKINIRDYSSYKLKKYK